jgi:MFS family permease
MDKNSKRQYYRVMQNPLRGIPKNTVVLGTASLLNDTASEMAAPLLPIFLTATLGAGPAAIGIIEGTAEATSSFLKVVSGYVSDRIAKRKQIVFAGYGLSAIARSALSITASWTQVLVLRFTDRIGKGIRTAPRDAIIADSTAPAYRGRSFGFHRALDNAGAILGPILAFVLISRLNFSCRMIFGIALIPGLLSALSIAAFVRERKYEKKTASLSLHLESIDHNFHRYLIVLLVFTLGNASDAFLILRAVDCGIHTAMIPLLWGGFNLVRCLISVPCSSLSDRIGRRPVIIMGWLVYALIYFAFAMANTPWHIALIFLGYGIYYGLTEGVERAFVADLVPAEIRATAYGLYNGAIGIAALPASIIFGALWKYAGMHAAFFFAVALAALASIGLLLFVKPKKTVS